MISYGKIEHILWESKCMSLPNRFSKREKNAVVTAPPRPAQQKKSPALTSQLTLGVQAAMLANLGWH